MDRRYPDAHFFRGFILLRDKKDPEAAIPGVPAVPCAPRRTRRSPTRCATLLAEAVKAAQAQ